MLSRLEDLFRHLELDPKVLIKHNLQHLESFLQLRPSSFRSGIFCALGYLLIILSRLILTPCEYRKRARPLVIIDESEDLETNGGVV